MGVAKYEVGQTVWVKAEVEMAVFDKHGLSYALIVRDKLFTEKDQDNRQHVIGIDEVDIRSER